MQRFMISFIVFVCVILIFDMMANDARITTGLYGALRVTARHFDNYASGIVAYLNRG